LTPSWASQIILVAARRPAEDCDETRALAGTCRAAGCRRDRHLLFLLFVVGLAPRGPEPDAQDKRAHDRMTTQPSASPTRAASLRERLAMYNGNRLNLGLFGANCSSGRSATNAASRVSLDAAVRKVDEIKAQARVLGREIEVFTVGQVVCRPTQGEAEEYTATR
jgi:hypothetical protein